MSNRELSIIDHAIKKGLENSNNTTIQEAESFLLDYYKQKTKCKIPESEMIHKRTNNKIQLIWEDEDYRIEIIKSEEHIKSNFPGQKIIEKLVIDSAGIPTRLYWIA